MFVRNEKYYDNLRIMWNFYKGHTATETAEKYHCSVSYVLIKMAEAREAIPEAHGVYKYKRRQDGHKGKNENGKGRPAKGNADSDLIELRNIWNDYQSMTAAQIAEKRNYSTSEIQRKIREARMLLPEASGVYKRNRQMEPGKALCGTPMVRDEAYYNTLREMWNDYRILTTVQMAQKYKCSTGTVIKRMQEARMVFRNS